MIKKISFTLVSVSFLFVSCFLFSEPPSKKYKEYVVVEGEIVDKKRLVISIRNNYKSSISFDHLSLYYPYFDLFLIKKNNEKIRRLRSVGAVNSNFIDLAYGEVFKFSYELEYEFVGFNEVVDMECMNLYWVLDLEIYNSDESYKNYKGKLPLNCDN